MHFFCALWGKRFCKVGHSVHVHCGTFKLYETVQCKRGKNSSCCCPQRLPQLHVGMYEYIHVPIPGKIDQKSAFPVRRLPWPARFGRLREVLNNWLSLLVTLLFLSSPSTQREEEKGLVLINLWVDFLFIQLNTFYMILVVRHACEAEFWLIMYHSYSVCHN